MSNRQNFFDRPLVIAAVGKARADNFRRCGGYLKKVGKNSMRYTSDPTKRSMPGAPPFARRSIGFNREYKSKDGTVKSRPTSPLKELIEYSYDFGTKTVVIGPMIFRNSASNYRVPEVLEKGGRVSTFIPSRVAAELAGKKHTGSTGKLTKVTIEPRPTMQLALKKSNKFIAAVWKASINRA